MSRRCAASASGAARRPSCSRLPSPSPCAVRSIVTLAGQAQKEFFVNQALCLLDAVQMRTVKASQSVPPALPIDSDCYRVKAPATGAWAGREDRVAVRIAGDWHYVEPVQGMTLFDQAADSMLIYRSGWKLAVAPALPAGGSAIDAEARAALGAVIQALKEVGILATAAP
jgi:hypothetical protein